MKMLRSPHAKDSRGASPAELRVAVQEDAFEDDESTPRPFIKWAGGKSGLRRELLSRTPKTYNTYFEAFLGGGALFFSLKPKRAVLSETNADLVNTYLTVKNRVYELLNELSKHSNTEAYFYALRAVDRTDDYASWSAIAKASRLIYLNKTCFNGLYRVNSKGQFNVPFGNYKSPNFCDRENLIACSKALSTAEIACRDFSQAAEKADKGDFIYFDPPYHPLSKTASFTTYTGSGFGEDEQIRLRDTCRMLDKRGVSFMLTNSDTPFVMDLYEGFGIERVSATRSINSNGEKRSGFSDLIIRNYASPS